MLFNSYIFILAFFPLTCFLYYLLNHYEKYRLAEGLLVVMSVGFYAYFHIWYVLILIGSIIINWTFSRMIIRFQRKSILIIGIILNVSSIFIFKYYNFFISNINAVFRSSIPLLKILMPLGISFFTFQQITYLVDTYRGETKEYKFLEYALFVSFFPQLIAGPIVLHNEMIPKIRDLKNKKFDNDRFAYGIYCFAIGLAKKVLLADSLAVGVDWGYANISMLGGFNTLFVVFCFSFQLYFDFSGYCDMACGIANCFNLELPVNFSSPYKATSIGDFWKRWHITLTRFLTKYIYIPLGGNRKGQIRTLINILIVFFISGLWHGANWTYVLWGMMHGIAMVAYRLSSNLWDKINKYIRMFVTFIFVSFAWIFFRAESIADIGKVFNNIFSTPNFTMNTEFCSKYDLVELTYIEEHIYPLKAFVNNHPSVNAWILFVLSCLIIFIPANMHEKKFVTGRFNAFCTVVILVWCTLSLSGMSTFLYFNF